MTNYDEIDSSNFYHYVALGEIAACMVLQRCEKNIRLLGKMKPTLADEMRETEWLLLWFVPPEKAEMLSGYDAPFPAHAGLPAMTAHMACADDVVVGMRDIRDRGNAEGLPTMFIMGPDKSLPGGEVLGERMVDEVDNPPQPVAGEPWILAVSG